MQRRMNVGGGRAGSVVFTVMDIVVHTPHGDADVSIVAHTSSATLGELITEVTGQAVPRLALVDGRAVDAGTPLDDAGLVVGAVVTTEPHTGEPMSDADIEVAQIAGPGAGRRMRLGPGRYRIGPGRRASADELELAPVEQSFAQIVVSPTADVSEVTVTSDGSDVALDGVPVSSTTRWNDEILTAGRRAFRLVAPALAVPTRTLSAPDRDGIVSFSRPPRRPSAAVRWPIVDGLRDATGAAPTLWERRSGHPDAYQVPFGVRVDTTGAPVACVDLSSERAVAVAGSERFRSALARTLVVEAATLHGPADLAITVLTSPDRVAAWDWAKWFPHVRADGPAAIWDTPHDVAAWVDSVIETQSSRTTQQASAVLTIAVVDDPELWNRRDAPLRPILASPPNDLRLIALCDDETHAPAICTAVISETDDDVARLHSFAGPGSGSSDLDAIRPALVEVDVAVVAARALAPLADIDLEAPIAPTSSTVEPPDVADLVDLADPSEVVARWRADTPRSTAAIGRNAGGNVEIDVDRAVTVVTGGSIGDRFDVATTALLTLCADRSPDALWVVPVGFDDHATSAELWRMPHATERHGRDVAIEPDRLIARLRALLADADGPERVVIVADGSTSVSTGEQLLGALADAARTLDGVTMLVVGDRPDLATAADTVIRLETTGGRTGSPTQRVATVVDGNTGRRCILPQPGLRPTVQPGAPLELRPFVIGRALTPLERRLAQRHAEFSNVASPAVVAAIDVLSDAATRDDATTTARSPRAAVAPPLPTHLDLEHLWATSPGDGVPFGVTDDPDSAVISTRWWEPGSGSLLLFGSRRSGVDQVASTVILGVTERFGHDDVRLVIIESSPSRRRILSRLDGDLGVAATDQVDDVSAVIDGIATELDRQREETEPGTRAPMVVVIGDLVELRRSHDDELIARLDDILVDAAAPASGIDVIAYASELDGAGPFATAATHRLIGTSSSRDELTALGVRRPEQLDGITGRCWAFPDDRIVQLATSDTPIETLLRRRGGTG